MKLQDFKNKIYQKNAPVEFEITSSLSKELCSLHTGIEVEGEKGSKIPVLLTYKMKENILVLVRVREKLDINSDFMFIKLECKDPLRGDFCLRTFARECGAECPNKLTSTRLRKQLATMAQLLGLSDTSQDILAKFMGHDIKVHREIYKLPENTLEMAKVSKMLHLINSGSIAEFKGMDFDDIEFDQSAIVETDVDEITKVEEKGYMEDNEQTTFNENNMFDKTTFKKWSRSEEEAALRQLGHFLAKRKCNGKTYCKNAKLKEAALKNRTWIQLKNFIRNRIVKSSKLKFNSLPLGSFPTTPPNDYI